MRDVMGLIAVIHYDIVPRSAYSAHLKFFQFTATPYKSVEPRLGRTQWSVVVVAIGPAAW